jgi:sphingomyelin phosphodiesterase
MYKPLSPAWWHKVSEAMELDDAVFDAYWNNRYKSSPMTPECDEACRINVVCGIRAGKSELRCDYDPSSSTPRPTILDRKDEEACGISLIVKKKKNRK